MKWWQIRKSDADLDRELQSDLELEEEEQRANGLSAEQARHAARRAFGNTTLIREHIHEAWGWAPVERLLQDARYAMRQLWRSPGFSIVAAMTLALGIGATTAIFTLVYDVMLRPLPFARPDRIVTIEEKVAEWSNLYPTVPVSANHFTVLATAQPQFRFDGGHAARLRTTRKQRAPSTSGGAVGHARNLLGSRGAAGTGAEIHSG